VKAPTLKYLLITAARNEEAFIELTIQSVVNQTVRPVRWIIVSDGSTDHTDEIVGRYATQHNWIELYRVPERKTRDFGGKANCFNSAYSRAKQLEFDVVGNVDADLSFEKDYYEFLMQKFAEDPKLGVGGTPFCEDGRTYDYRFSSKDHVSGAAQMFRRVCFEEIGGYVPVKGGGIDAIAVLTARTKGWHTQTFTDKVCEHHRPMGSANHRQKIAANFKLGQTGYRLGYHPVWQVFRTIYQMGRKPYVAGGLALFAGYFWAMARRVERPIGPEVIAFQRRDQMRRLLKVLGLHAGDSNLPVKGPVGPKSISKIQA
jgi:biofilm PGA synthesis N-glycosyltransferase PgaC